MPEVEQPGLDSSQEHQPTPLTSGEVEKLRSGDTTIEPTYAEKRQRFIEQASAHIRHEAAHAETAAKVLQGQPHNQGDAIDLGIEDELKKASKFQEEAVQIEQEAADQFDAENPT